jgi:formiminotetrahydrofolate cyclodeaminase
MEPFDVLLDRLGERTPAPGGGAGAAWTCALAAALAEMVARYSEDPDAAARSRELRGRALALAVRDGEAYAAYMAASADDKPAMLLAAADAVLAIAETAAEVAEIAARFTTSGRRSTVGDAHTGATLAAAAAAAAARLTEMDAPGDERAERARAAAERAGAVSA